ncbi:hypothetical protein ACOZ38_15480 [Sphaerisporangium viridialbum]|uniref:hypothetical protein n=1 Tax=Sphaerisporangium viridialbum TaxID=46189 RepID=UPI003C766B2D
MSDDKLSLSETAFLLILTQEAGEVSNTELQERYGLTLTGKERLHLNDLKLVESWKKGRAYVHVLTDAGWARLSEELRTGIAKPTGRVALVVYIALSVVLGGLHNYMGRTGNRLSDIFGQSSTPPSIADSPQVASSTEVEPVPARQPAPSADSAVEARIRAAYAELAEKPGTWIGLTEIRELISDLPRAAVDQTLRLMNRMPDVTLIPESNQKTLSQEDREAAVTIGDQAKHALWIGA